MTGNIDETALWERVAPQKGAPSLARQLTELLQEAGLRRQEYGRLGLNFDREETAILRGLICYYSGELQKGPGKSLERLPLLPSLRRLMELEILARGRYLAMAEELSQPEKGLMEALAENAGNRWRKLLKHVGSLGQK